VRFLLRTLSLSYLTRHKAKMLLTVLGVVVGVATFTAIRGAKGALLSGLKQTIDKLAGKAQLQIVSEGGVPEELQERIRDVPGVRAQSPVIEQISTVLLGNPYRVSPALPAHGESVLILGVDLLGDREMRDYGFEGQDADLDDPLLFLAQPDSVALTRVFAERAGLKIGDSFELQVPKGRKTVTVRGLLSLKGFAESFGGNLLVVDVYAAQELFGRGRRFDRLEVRLEDGVSLAAGTAALEKAVGPGYRVETPDRRGEQAEQIVGNFVAGFNISSGFALGVGTFLIFNAFNVSVNRRRRDIGTLRALGATPRQVRTLFLLEAVAVGLAGGALGLLAGAALSGGFLKMMGSTAEQVYGLTGVSHTQVTADLVLSALAVGVVASLVGAFAPAQAASSVPPTEALAKGTHAARPAPFSRRRLLAGAALVALSVLIALTRPLNGYLLVGAVGVPFLAGLVVISGPLASVLLRALSPLLARVSPVVGPLATDSLLSNPRRTSGTVTAMVVSLAFVLGVAGYMASTKAVFSRWMDEILTSDLYVRASANLVRPDFRFPGNLRQELLKVPGVRAVESYRGVRLRYRGDTVLLVTIEMGPTMDRTRREYLQGDEAGSRRGLLQERGVIVSDNFWRRFGLGVGDAVELPTPSGIARFPIGGVVRDFSSDRGVIFLDRAVYLDLWKDDRVDTYDVNLHKGVDAAVARDAVRRVLAGRYPALVSTRKEFNQEINKLVDAFYVLTQITTALAVVVAFLGIVTSLLISVVERSREIGILKSLGALSGQIRRSVVTEALCLAVVGFLLAIPAGSLLGRFMETTVAEVFAGWQMPHRFAGEILLQLAVVLPVVSAVAAWLPARQAAAVRVTEALEYE